MALRAYRGYVVVALFLIAALAGAAPVVVYPLAAGTLAYLTFFAPVWCGALTRGDQICRNNARGVFGCHLRQNRWQEVRFMMTPRTWRVLNRGLWTSPSAVLATLSALVSFVSFAAWAVGAATG